MRLPKEHSRSIAVRDLPFRWAYLPQNDFLPPVILVDGQGDGQLKIFGPASQIPSQLMARLEQVTPAIVSKWIELAVDLGWNPSGDDNTLLEVAGCSGWLDDEGEACAKAVIGPDVFHHRSPFVT